jgi:hypothetical protein
MCHREFARRPAVASGYRALVAIPLQPQLIKELDAALAKLESTDPAAAGPHWGAMHKLLLKAKVDPQALMRIVGARDVAELKRAVARAKGEEVPEAAAGEGTGSGAASTDAAASASGAAHAPDIELPVLQDALRMFRKRLKLMQLDADSKIGHGPMSGTGQHRIQSMVPPRDFPIAVWEALARMGKLRREGDGFYSLIEQTGAQW